MNQDQGKNKANSQQQQSPTKGKQETESTELSDVSLDKISAGIKMVTKPRATGTETEDEVYIGNKRA
ncbi:MAG: hypothetical protein HZC43_04820 [Nitrosomonadales bacterium]|nr:hypothetical protein [Nitrosomonadales bacterium]